MQSKASRVARGDALSVALHGAVLLGRGADARVSVTLRSCFLVTYDEKGATGFRRGLRLRRGHGPSLKKATILKFITCESGTHA